MAQKWVTEDELNYMKMGGKVVYAQQGATAQGGDDQVMQLIQAYAEAAKVNPQDLIAQLKQMSPEDQQQAIQNMAQELQGGQEGEEQDQSLQEEQQEMQGGGQDQMMQQIAQAIQQGADPQQVMAALVKQGVPEEQAGQMIQAVAQQMQGAPQMAMGGSVSPEKAKQILKDGTIYGKSLTDKQRRFFGAMANKSEDGSTIVNFDLAATTQTAPIEKNKNLKNRGTVNGENTRSPFREYGGTAFYDEARQDAVQRMIQGGNLHTYEGKNIKAKKGIKIKAQPGTNILHVTNPNDPRLKAYQDSSTLAANSKAVQDYYKSKGYDISANVDYVPSNYIQIAKEAMKDLGERYNKHWKKKEDIFGHVENDEIPFLIDKSGKSYMRGSTSNFLERMTNPGDEIYGKEPYVKAFKEMYSKLGNVPAGFTGLLDMYNSGFMDLGVPVQLLHPTIKPTSSLSVSGTGKRKGNYDEIFTYDVPSITPKLKVVYDENKNAPSKKAIASTEKKSAVPTASKTQQNTTKLPITEQTKIIEKQSTSIPQVIDKSTGKPLPDFPIQFRANPTGGYTVYQNRNGKFIPIGTSKTNTGKVTVEQNYAKGGYVEPHFYNITIPGSEFMGGRKDYLMDANYEQGGNIRNPHFYNMNIPGSEFMGRRKDYLMDANYAVGGTVPEGYHKMPSGALMPDALHKQNGNVGQQDLGRFMTGNNSIQGGQGAKKAQPGYNVRLTPSASESTATQIANPIEFLSPEQSAKMKADKAAIDKKIVEDRKKRIETSNKAGKNMSAIPGGKGWTKENIAKSLEGTPDRFRAFPNDPNSFFDEYLNPGVQIGSMARDLAQSSTPLDYVKSIGTPLALGALGEFTPKQNTKLGISSDDMMKSFKKRLLEKEKQAGSEILKDLQQETIGTYRMYADPLIKEIVGDIPIKTIKKTDLPAPILNTVGNVYGTPQFLPGLLNKEFFSRLNRFGGSIKYDIGGFVQGGMLVGDKQYYPYGGYVEYNSEGGAPSQVGNRAEWLAKFGTVYPVKAAEGAGPGIVSYNTFTNLKDEENPFLTSDLVTDPNQANTQQNLAAAQGVANPNVNQQQFFKRDAKKDIEPLQPKSVEKLDVPKVDTENALSSLSPKDAIGSAMGMSNPISMGLSAIGAAGDAITGAGSAIASMAGNEKAARALTKAGSIGKVAESIGNVVPIPGVGKAVGALASIFAAPFTAWGENIAEAEKKKAEKYANYAARQAGVVDATQGQYMAKYGKNVSNYKQRIMDDIYNDFDKYMKK